MVKSQGILKLQDFHIVASDTVQVSSSGSGTSTITPFPHNLNFVPVPFAFLTNVTLSFTGSPPLVVSQNANIPLPTYASTDLSGANVAFTSWLYAVCDDENLYIIFHNTTGQPIGPLDINYYLCQQQAQQLT